MYTRSFHEKLEAAWAQGKFICVGLDTSPEKVPAACRDLEPESASWLKFNKALIDATADIALAFKPNLAFYLGKGAEGVRVLERTCEFIAERYPSVPIILDMKSADIGSTNEGYASFAFDVCRADAITVHHKHGMPAMKPFLDRADKGVIVVVRTSNPGADEFQDQKVWLTDEETNLMGDAGLLNSLKHNSGWLNACYEFERAAWRVANFWNSNGNCGVVAGATNDGLARVRKIVGDCMPILIPGIGAQGGEVEPTVKAGRNSRDTGMIINSSRGIIYASANDDFAEAARIETQRLARLVNTYRMEP